MSPFFQIAIQRLKGFMADRPYGTAALAGLSVGLICLAIFVAYEADEKLRQLARRHTPWLQTIGQVRQMAVQTLRDLQLHHAPDCSESSLNQLRARALSAEYFSEVGVYDAQGRLACTTLAGRLPQPLTATASDVATYSRDALELRLIFDYPLLAGDGKIRSVMMQHGRFHVVVNPWLRDQVYRNAGDAILYREASGQIHPIHINARLPADWEAKLKSGALAALNGAQFSWQEHAFIVSQSPPGSRFVVQTVLPLGDFLRQHGREFSLIGGLCLLLAMAVFAAFLPRLLAWRRLENRIAQLLEEGKVECAYQPVIDLNSGMPVGCEVLMRLRDGQTLLTPEQVLPLVAKRKLNWELDRAVVLAGLRELSQAGIRIPGFRVSFNFFQENLSYSKIHHLIEQQLRRAPLQGLQIALEVMDRNYQRFALQEVAQLQQAGYSVSVDNCGIGPSSLGSLRSLAPDIVKIDKSIVFDMEVASLRSSLIPEIIQSAHALGARVVAEGIENEEQLHRLKQQGVEYGQGYYFSPPMDIHQLVDYLRRTTPLFQAHAA